MNNIPTFSELQFHDSTLNDIFVEGSTVQMDVEAIAYDRLIKEKDDYPLVSVTLWIDGVTKITENHQVVHQLAIQGSFGDIISFDRTEQGFVLAVSWCHLGPGARDGFSVIELSGPEIAVRCGPYTYFDPYAQ